METPENVLRELMARERWMRRLASSLIHPSDVDDVVQDTWVAALERPPRRTTAVPAWIRTVVRRVATSRRDHEAAQHARAVAAAEVDPVSSAADASADDLRYRVAKAVFRLDETYRAVIFRRYFDGQPPREIAVQLGLTPAAVETRLRRGLEKLRERLDGDFGGRAAWTPLLTPFTISAASTAPTALSLTGALAMSSKIKLGVVLAVSVGLACAVFVTLENDAPDAIPGDDGTRAEESKTVTAAPDRATARKAAPRSAAPAIAPATATSDARPAAPTRIAASRRLAVQGVVRDESDRPVGNARLVLSHYDASGVDQRRGFEPARVVRTDPAGRYRFDGLEPGIDLVLDVTATGHCHDAVRVRPGDRRDFALFVPGHIAGRVVDHAGHAVANAAVRAASDCARGRRFVLGTRVEADADGRFEIRDLRPGTYRVDARSPGRIGASMRPKTHVVVRRSESTRVLLSVAKGVRLRGRVVDTRGLPLVGARVTPTAGSGAAPIVAGVDGRFDVVCDTGWIQMSIEAAGRLPRHQRVKLTPAETERGVAERTFRLDLGSIVRGRVTDEADEPIAGARIRFRDRAAIATDASGRFALVVPPERACTIAASRRGYAIGVARVAATPAGAVRDDVVLRLQRGAVIEGRVVDGNEAPLADHPVVCVSRDERDYGPARYRSRTGADGSFRFDGLLAGAYAISADPTSSMITATETARTVVRVEPQGSRTGVRLVPAPRMALRGRVVDQQDRPLENVLITHRQRRTTSGPDGRFVLEGAVVGSKCIVGAAKDDFTFLRDASILPDEVDPTSGELTLRMAAIPEGIRGFVLDADTRRPVESFWIRVTSKATKRPIVAHYQDPRGAFWFTRIDRPGDYQVEAGTADGRVAAAPRMVRLARAGAAPSIELTVARAAALTGRVLAPDGTPAVRAEVVVRDPATGRRLGKRTAYTDANGVYRLSGVPTGPVEITASHAAHYAVRRAQAVVAGENRVPALTLGREGASVKVTVRDTSGKPVPAARVKLLTLTGRTVGWDRAKYFDYYIKQSDGTSVISERVFRREIERTDRSGVLLRRFVAPGEYQVDVTAPGFTSLRRRMRVDPGDGNSVRITLVRE